MRCRERPRTITCKRAIRLLSLALLLCLLDASERARASDFWDEVRNPGLFAHREHLRKARDALLANRRDLALTEGEAAIASCAGCADGYALRGRALTASGRHPEAVAAFEQALGLHDDALDASADTFAAALSALHVGRPELAASVLGRALALAREPVARGRALAMLADALQAQGPSELKRAIATYAEAMRDDQARKYAMLGLALALHRADEREQALLLARRASESDGNPAADWLPDSERSARAALWFTAIGDENAAQKAWQQAEAAGGPWAAHARAAQLRDRHSAGVR